MLALVSSWAEAQNFDNVNIAEASSVCSVAQDERGVLWFGTDNGLFAYDGYRTITPTQQLNTSPPHHLTTPTPQHLNISPPASTRCSCCTMCYTWQPSAD